MKKDLYGDYLRGPCVPDYTIPYICIRDSQTHADAFKHVFNIASENIIP